MTIQDRIISFETAKLAAKLGFNLYVIGTHHYNYYDENGEGGVIGWGHLNSKNAPMSPQGLLQKWLREEHDYNVFAVLDGKHFTEKNPKKLYIISNKKWCWFVVTPQGTIHKPLNEEGDNYEDVLERGLMFALQMFALQLLSHVKENKDA